MISLQEHYNQNITEYFALVERHENTPNGVERKKLYVELQDKARYNRCIDEVNTNKSMNRNI